MGHPRKWAKRGVGVEREGETIRLVLFHAGKATALCRSGHIGKMPTDVVGRRNAQGIGSRPEVMRSNVGRPEE